MIALRIFPARAHTLLPPPTRYFEYLLYILIEMIIICTRRFTTMPDFCQTRNLKYRAAAEYFLKFSEQISFLRYRYLSALMRALHISSASNISANARSLASPSFHTSSLPCRCYIIDSITQAALLAAIAIRHARLLPTWTLYTLPLHACLRLAFGVIRR